MWTSERFYGVYNQINTVLDNALHWVWECALLKKFWFDEVYSYSVKKMSFTTHFNVEVTAFFDAHNLQELSKSNFLNLNQNMWKTN